MTYQCSEASTSNEIASVFKNAIRRSDAMKRNRFNDIILVFLDVRLGRQEGGICRFAYCSFSAGGRPAGGDA